MLQIALRKWDTQYLDGSISERTGYRPAWLLKAPPRGHPERQANLASLSHRKVLVK